MDPASPRDTVTLRGAVEFPVLGLSVSQPPPGQARRTVAAALDAGYRHIDTAAVYRNERAVGAAIAGQAAGPVFVTTKVWNDDQGYRRTLAAFERSRRNLGTEVIDLLLMHWPLPAGREETWRAMEHLLEQGAVRAIGTCNFMARHLGELLDIAVHPPSVNQIELTPYNYRSRLDVIRLCQEHGIAVAASGPLSKGLMLADPPLAAIAARHRRTTAQVLIRWSLQKGFVPLPRSIHPSHIASNADVFGFRLPEADMAALDALDRNLVTSPRWDPALVP